MAARSLPSKLKPQLAQAMRTRDYQRINYLMTTHEFPFDTTRALEFALFRTYRLPSSPTPKSATTTPISSFRKSSSTASIPTVARPPSAA